MLSVIKANFKIAGSVFLAVMLVQGATAFGQTVLYKGKINTFKLNIRTGPSRDAEVITAVAKGQVLDVVDISGGVGGWVTVLWEGQRGYVRNRPSISSSNRSRPRRKQT